MMVAWIRLFYLGVGWWQWFQRKMDKFQIQFKNRISTTYQLLHFEGKDERKRKIEDDCWSFSLSY